MRMARRSQARTATCNKSYAALDRIARQEATLGKLDSAKLDACLTKQDESQVRASMRDGDRLGVDSTPAIFIDGEHIVGCGARRAALDGDRPRFESRRRTTARTPLPPPQATS